MITMPTPHILSPLVGKNIFAIHWSDYHLQFDTRSGESFAFTVEGDCCSHSYFHDFFGVDKLLNNPEVIAVGDVSLRQDDPINRGYDEYTEVYGYELVTVDPIWGEVTSVFSFRNESNGFYGGWMTEATPNSDPDARIIVVDQHGS